MTRRTWLAAIAAAAVVPALPAPGTTPWRVEAAWDFKRNLVTNTARCLRDGLPYGLTYQITREQIVNDPDLCARLHRSFKRAMRNIDRQPGARGA